MFESLDFLYLPAPEFEKAVRHYVEILGGELKWKIRAFDAHVACVQLSKEGPPVLLADHLKEGGPRLLYRVASIKAAMKSLKGRGWAPDGEPFEIPPGPCCSFVDPAGNRLGIFENKRPGAAQSFKGRFDKD